MNQSPNTRHHIETDYSSSVATKERGEKKNGDQGTSRDRETSVKKTSSIRKEIGKEKRQQ